MFLKIAIPRGRVPKILLNEAKRIVAASAKQCSDISRFVTMVHSQFGPDLIHLAADLADTSLSLEHELILLHGDSIAML